MTSEERQLTALRGGQPDRVPVTVWLNPYVSRWASGIREGIDPEAAGYAEVLEAARRYADAEYDWSFPAGFFYSAWDVHATSERVGSERVRHSIRTPRGPLTCVVQDRSGGGTEKHWIESIEDAKRLLSIPYERVRPPLDGFHATRAASQGRYLSKVTLNDPACTVGLIDPMTCAFWTKDERPLLKEMLDIAFERICDSLDYLLSNSVGPLYYFNGPEYALPPLMSPDDFEEFVVEYDTKLIARIHAHGQLTQVHSHGRVNRFLESFAHTRTDSLNVLEPPPLGDVVLADAKRRVGGAMCLVGNVQYDDVAAASEAQVDELVHECIEQGAPGGGFILALCAAPYEVPLPAKTARNLMRYMQAGREYGSY
ncbi:MAG: uroporphyrinogen decarboxylase family protein [Anaerolineae bacterium]